MFKINKSFKKIHKVDLKHIPTEFQKPERKGQNIIPNINTCTYTKFPNCFPNYFEYFYNVNNALHLRQFFFPESHKLGCEVT